MTTTNTVYTPLKRAYIPSVMCKINKQNNHYFLSFDLSAITFGLFILSNKEDEFFKEVN